MDLLDNQRVGESNNQLELLRKFSRLSINAVHASREIATYEKKSPNNVVPKDVNH